MNPLSRMLAHRVSGRIGGVVLNGLIPWPRGTRATPWYNTRRPAGFRNAATLRKTSVIQRLNYLSLRKGRPPTSKYYVGSSGLVHPLVFTPIKAIIPETPRSPRTGFAPIFLQPKRRIIALGRIRIRGGPREPVAEPRLSPSPRLFAQAGLVTRNSHVQRYALPERAPAPTSPRALNSGTFRF